MHSGTSSDGITGQAWVPVTIAGGASVQILEKIMNGLTQERLFGPLRAVQAGGLTLEIMTTGTTGEALDSNATYC